MCIVFFDKGLVFGDSELGRCVLSLADIRQRHFTEWWPVVAADGSMVGQVLLTFTLPHEDSTLLTLHSQQQPSLEFREDFMKRLAEASSDGEDPLSLCRLRGVVSQEDLERTRNELNQQNLKMRVRRNVHCVLR